jgi:hypothetical protein
MRLWVEGDDQKVRRVCNVVCDAQGKVLLVIMGLFARLPNPDLLLPAKAIQASGV